MCVVFQTDVGRKINALGEVFVFRIGLAKDRRRLKRDPRRCEVFVILMCIRSFIQAAGTVSQNTGTEETRRGHQLQPWVFFFLNLG